MSDTRTAEALHVGSWPVVLQQALVEDAAIVHFTKSQFEKRIGDYPLEYVPRRVLWSVEEVLVQVDHYPEHFFAIPMCHCPKIDGHDGQQLSQTTTGVEQEADSIKIRRPVATTWIETPFCPSDLLTVQSTCALAKFPRSGTQEGCHTTLQDHPNAK